LLEIMRLVAPAQNRDSRSVSELLFREKSPEQRYQQRQCADPARSPTICLRCKRDELRDKPHPKCKGEPQLGLPAARTSSSDSAGASPSYMVDDPMA
jgi:hypothetical protein